MLMLFISCTVVIWQHGHAHSTSIPSTVVNSLCIHTKRKGTLKEHYTCNCWKALLLVACMRSVHLA